MTTSTRDVYQYDFVRPCRGRRPRRPVMYINMVSYVSVGVDDHIDPQCTVMKYILGGYPYACKFER